MKAPNLMDIGADIPVKTSNDLDALDTEVGQARASLHLETNKKKYELNQKIKDLEKKIKKHELKEGMLDTIINTTYAELDNLQPNEFTKRGQKQAVLIKQLEALSILHDTLMKYEDMVLKYHKILIDLENNKFNSFLRVESLKKEEKQEDDNLVHVLRTIQEQFMGNNPELSGPQETLLDEIKQELENDNY